MKKSIISLLALCMALLWTSESRAVSVTLTIDEGAQRTAAISKAESNLATLLSNINECEADKDNMLVMNNLGIDDFAKNSLARLWAQTHFKCDDNEVVEYCWIFENGTMMVSHIPLIISPVNDQEFGAGTYQEAVVEFDRSGVITDFRLALDAQIGESLGRCGSVVEKERQMIILSYVERFRTAYNQHDIGYIEQIFSDDALIITGKVVTAKVGGDNNFMSQKVVYNKQTKQQYISNLKTAFRRNKWIDVKFSQIGENGEMGGCAGITRSNINPNMYGVRLRQEWRSSNYNDEGYLFLLWDFSNEDKPQIHVRTWQPEWVGGKKVEPDDNISTLAGFDL